MKDNITYSQSELYLRSTIIDSQKSIIYVKACDENRVLDILKSLGMNGWIWKESTGQLFNLKTGNAIIAVKGNKDKPIKRELRTNNLSSSIRNLFICSNIKILIAQISGNPLKDDLELLSRLEELKNRNKVISKEDRQVVVFLQNGVELDSRLVSLCEKINVSISGKDKMTQYGIKPIRTRFVSGKMECATISQLRSNFSPKAIYKAYPQLLKWLDQNHEREIRELLVTNEDRICKDNNQMSLFLLYKIFFGDMFKEREITDLTSLFWNWYSNSERDTKNYRYLCKEIRERPWGNHFFLNISGEYAQSQDKDNRNSQNDMFRIYCSFCEGCVFFIDIKNLSELYAYLAKSIDYLREFEVLDEQIRRHDWGNDFFIRIIPEFYILSNDYAIVKKGNLKLPIDNRDGLFSLYDYFLHYLFEDKGIDNLLGLYIYLLFDTESDNSRSLYDEISKQIWRVSFFSELIKELIRLCHEDDSNNHYNINQIGLSDESADGMFSIYRYFLGTFLEDNSINNIEELYCFWSNSNSACFANLHDEIINTQWGESFLNNIVKRLLIDFNEVGTFSESRTMADIDEKNLLSFYKKYFGFYLSSHKIKNISDLYVGLSKDNNYKECFECLEDVLYNNMWGLEKTLTIYRDYNNLFSKDRWLTILQKLDEFLDKYHEKWSQDKEKDDIYKKNLYQIAKLFVEDFGKLRDGYERLIKLEKMKYPDALRYLKVQRNKEKVISKNFINLYAQYDRTEWEQHQQGYIIYEVDDVLKASAKSLHEKWILITQELIHQVVTKDQAWEKLCYIVDYIRLKKNRNKKIDDFTSMGYAIDENSHMFFDAFIDKKIGDRDGKERLIKVSEYCGKSFLEIRFVYALIGLSHHNSAIRQSAIEILKSIKEIYPVANRYLSYQSIPNMTEEENYSFSKLLDGENDEHHLFVALRGFCKNMTKFNL